MHARKKLADKFLNKKMSNTPVGKISKMYLIYITGTIKKQYHLINVYWFQATTFLFYCLTFYFTCFTYNTDPNFQGKYFCGTFLTHMYIQIHLSGISFSFRFSEFSIFLWNPPLHLIHVSDILLIYFHNYSYSWIGTSTWERPQLSGAVLPIMFTFVSHFSSQLQSVSFTAVICLPVNSSELKALVARS